MSPRQSTAAPAHSGRTAMVVIAVAIVALGLTLLVRAKPAPSLLDPSSGARQGARGLVLLLRDQGAELEVTTDLDPQEQGRVVVLVDRLSDDQRDAVSNWVRHGGVAIIADPASSLVGAPALRTETESADEGGGDPNGENPHAILAASIARGDCEIPALGRLDEISFEADRRPLPPEIPEGASDAIRFPPRSGDVRCFAEGAAGFVVVKQRGEGLLIGLGENHVLTNELLTAGDNAALATALMAPNHGSRVVVLRGTGRPPAVEFGGDRTLFDLVRPGIWMALLTALIGFVVLALSRAWRVGRPVSEPLPAGLAGSELAVATGNLMERAGHADRAAQLLRYRFHRDLCAVHLVSPSAQLDELDRVVSSRTGLASGSILHALAPAQVADPQRLVELANELHRLRLAVITGRTNNRMARPGDDVRPPGAPTLSDQEIR